MARRGVEEGAVRKVNADVAVVSRGAKKDEIARLERRARDGFSGLSLVLSGARKPYGEFFVEDGLDESRAVDPSKGGPS